MPPSLLTWFAETAVAAALLAGFAALLCWRRLPIAIRPATRHALWLLVLIKMLTPPVIHISWPKLQPQRETRVEAITTESQPSTVLTEPVRGSIAAPQAIAFDPASTSSSPTLPQSLAAPSQPWSQSTTTTPAPMPREPKIVKSQTIAPRAASSLAARTPKSAPTSKAIAQDQRKPIIATAPLSAPNAASPPPLPLPSPPQAGNALPSAMATTEPLPAVSWEDAERWAFGVWIAGAIAVACWQAAALWRFRRRVNQGGYAPEWLEAMAEEIAIAMKVRPPAAVLVRGLTSPAVWCFGRPRLLIPEALADRIDPKRWRMIIAHEFAHLARRDHWTLWLEMIAAPIWWWNPLLWLVLKRVRAEADRACDARVAAAWPQQRRAYAEAIIDVCQWLVGPPAPAKTAARPAAPVLSFGNSSHLLERRLIMILNDRPIAPRLSWAGLAALVLLAGFFLPVWSYSRAQGGLPAKADTKPAAASTSASNATAATTAAPASAAKATASGVADNPFAASPATTKPAAASTARASAPSFSNQASADPFASTSAATTAAASPAATATNLVESTKSPLIEEARDAIESARVLTEIKAAELDKAKAELAAKLDHLAHLEQLAKNGTISKDEVSQAQYTATAGKANVAIKEAERKQALTAMMQAERRLTSALSSASPARTASSAMTSRGSANTSAPDPGQDNALKALNTRIDGLETQIANLRKLLEQLNARHQSSQGGFGGGGLGGEGGGGGGGAVHEDPPRPTALQGQARADNSPKSAQALTNLDQEIDFPFESKTSLREVLQYIKMQSRDKDAAKGIAFYVDQNALTEAGISEEAEISLQLEGASIKTGLALILRQAELTYCIRDGIVIITTEDSIDEYIDPSAPAVTGTARSASK